MQIDVVSLQEGMNLHPGLETQQAANLPLGQAFATVSFQRQGFKEFMRQGIKEFMRQEFMRQEAVKKLAAGSR
jgi:hypothetical protein